MTSTHIRSTCTSCGAALEAPATRLIVQLPRSTDSTTSPLLLLGCPVCTGSSTTQISWRTAAYLLEGGATSVVAPDDTAVRPTRPERLPELSAPLTLDDLIDLHAALDTDIPTS
ncbi:MAG TPA: hypothetical protein VM097_02775 [Mycobacteriales bacterium]|nr:hypothetical protein [Mycobacteriales bacterium]